MFIRPNDFCQINTDKYVEEFGIKRNHYIYVASLKVLPLDPADPYLQRVYVLTHKVTKDGHTKPDEGLFLIDPRELNKVTEGRQKKFYKILQEDFSTEDDENTEVENIVKDTPLVATPD